MGEDLILADQVDSTQSAPGAGLYQPQEFRIPVGPIFNFVTGELIVQREFCDLENNFIQMHLLVCIIMNSIYCVIKKN